MYQMYGLYVSDVWLVPFACYMAVRQSFLRGAFPKFFFVDATVLCFHHFYRPLRERTLKYCTYCTSFVFFINRDFMTLYGETVL